MSQWEPKIVAFLCSWSSYPGADYAGLTRLAYPPNIRIIKVPCAGRINPKFILSALRRGADGVWISACHPGDCHYVEGNLYARRKFALMKSLLEHTGIEPGRVHFSWISATEGHKFADVAKEVVSSARALGPAKHMIKKEAEVA
jgi:F420-non-reducing hydrogenase iron-sulfur subunit